MTCGADWAARGRPASWLKAQVAQRFRIRELSQRPDVALADAPRTDPQLDCSETTAARNAAEISAAALQDLAEAQFVGGRVGISSMLELGARCRKDRRRAQERLAVRARIAGYVVLYLTGENAGGFWASVCRRVSGMTAASRLLRHGKARQAVCGSTGARAATAAHCHGVRSKVVDEMLVACGNGPWQADSSALMEDARARTKRAGWT